MGIINFQIKKHLTIGIDEVLGCRRRGTLTGS